MNLIKNMKPVCPVYKLPSQQLLYFDNNPSVTFTTMNRRVTDLFPSRPLRLSDNLVVVPPTSSNQSLRRIVQEDTCQTGDSDHKSKDTSSNVTHSSSTFTGNSHLSYPVHPSDAILESHTQHTSSRGSQLDINSQLSHGYPGRSFPTSAPEDHYGTRYKTTDIEDLEEIINTASQCYGAHDYNQMVFVLQKVKVTPQLSNQQAMTIRFGLGLGLYKLSVYDIAMSHFLKAEHIAKQENDKGNICLMSYYLGEIEYAQNKFLSAAGYFEITINNYDKHNVGVTYNVNVPSLSALYCKRGTTLRYGSKVMEAVRLYKMGVEFAKKASEYEDELSAHTSLGNLYQSVGEYAKAVEEYKATVELAEKVKDYVSLGWAHGNIGNAFLGLMKRDKALYHLNEAFRLTVLHEPVPQAIGRAYNNLGTAYQATNNLEMAKENYQFALNQAIYGEDLPGQARVYGNLGNLLMIQNKYSDAIAHYTETLTISRDRATQITAYHNRGCARYERAETERKSYLESGEGNIELTTGTKSNSTYIGSEVKDCEEEHKFIPLPDHLCKYYHDAQSDLERVVKHHEQTFQDIKGSQRGLSLSVSLFETNARTFQRLQDCSYFLNHWQQALVYAEQSRARTLGELLLAKHLRHDHLQLSFRTPLDLPQIISIVQQQSLPVVFMSYTGSRLLIWVLTPIKETPIRVSINLYQTALEPNQFKDKSFDHLVRYLLNESTIENKIDMYGKCNYDESTMLNDLHDLIAKPLLRLLKSSLPPDSNLQDIILISDSYTKLIPISALQDRASKKFFGDMLRFHSMDSLLTMGIIQQLPSIVVSVPLDSNDMCIVGNPTIPSFKYLNHAWNLGQLPCAEEEAHRVAHVLRAVPILGNEALKDVILSKLNHSKVVHLATHGSATSGFLVFAGSNPLSLDDEAFAKTLLLFPEDIEGLTIPAALVVLSSCDSGRGAMKADGIQGIARSFLLAGAQAVLTSLWRVPDESASFFMYFFYRYLVDGLPSFTALQKAAHSIRCFAKYGGYIHWSGYQLQGREIKFVSSQNDRQHFDDLLGPVTIFPRLNEVLMIKKSLMVNSKHVPSPAESMGLQTNIERDMMRRKALPQRSDVQLLYGSLATRPMEIVADYISHYHKYYTGGIYWIPGHCHDLTTACLQHIKELLLQSSSTSGLSADFKDLTELFISLTEPVLLVLDQFTSLPLSFSPLDTLIRKSNVHIMITTHISSLPSKIADEAHKTLNRGCLQQELRPLPFLLSLQRIIYHIMSQFDLAPMNKEQRIFEEIEEATRGNPALLDLTCAVLTDCIESCNCDPTEGLEKFNERVVKVTANELSKLHEKKKIKYDEEHTSLSISDHQGVLTLKKNIERSTVTKSVESDTNINPAIIFTQSLIQYISLNFLEYFLLCCLSFLNNIPLHSAVIDKLENILIKIIQKDTEMDLQKQLKRFNLLVRYPHPVLQTPKQKMNTFNSEMITDSCYYFVPPVITEALHSVMENEDKVVICSVLYHTLDELSPNKQPICEEVSEQVDSEETEMSNQCCHITLHCIGLREVLLSCVSQEWNLFGKDVFKSVVGQYIKEKINVREEEGLIELLVDLER